MALGLFVAGFIEPGQTHSVAGIIETIIEFVDQEIVVFDVFKTNKLTNLIKNIDKCKVVKVTDEGCNNWSDLRNKYSKAIKQNNVDTVIFTKLFIWPGFTRFDDRNFVKFINELKKHNFNYSWTGGTKQVLSKLLFIMVASKLCENVYHYVVDPKEIDFTRLKFNHFRRLYYLKREGCDWVPLFEHQLVNIKPSNVKKEIDFTMYCTAYAKERQWLIDLKDELESVDNWDVKVLCIGDRGSGVSQTEYYEKLSRSRYTAVIKSYDETTFSSWRLFEAVVHNCLSFVFSDVALEECRLTYPYIYNIIKRDLIVDGVEQIKRKIAKWSENRRFEILMEIKATPDWKLVESKSVKQLLGKVKGVKV